MLQMSRLLAVPVTVFLVLLLLIFSRLMNFELRKDEQLYAAPARLLSDYKLYSDFFYNHTPGSAWLFHWVMNGIGTDHLLFAARLGVFAGWMVFGVCLIAITFRLTRSPAMATLAVLLIMTNEALLNQTGMTATNNLLPLVATYVGLGLFVLGLSNRQFRLLMILASGIIISMAAVFKANAIVFVPVVVAAAFLLPRDVTLRERLKQVVAPLAVGGILGSIPILYYLAVDPNKFIAHVISFHTGPHLAYWLAHSGGDEDMVAMSAGSKALLAYGMWFNNANLLFMFAAIFLSACLLQTTPLKTLIHRVSWGRIFVVLACVIAALVMGFVPTPGFPQYFTQPLACTPLLLALLYAELDAVERQRAQPGIVAISLVMALAGLPQLIQYAPRLVSPSSWTVERVHGAGLKISQQLANAGVSGKIATLAPIYPLEGGLSVYPVFATGQFAYRTAEFTDNNLRKYYRSTSPTEVPAFLAADPPAGILVGFEARLEAPLVKFAEQNGYRRIENLGISDRYGEAVLYISPAGDRPN